MKTSLRWVALSAGLLVGLLVVGCSVPDDGATQETPATRSDDPARIEDPFPSTPPMSGPETNPPTPGR
jgi:hypothetical protein